MSTASEHLRMQLTITVSDEILREAEARSLSAADFVDMLIDKGFAAVSERATVSNAIDRIRALRSAPSPFECH